MIAWWCFFTVLLLGSCALAIADAARADDDDRSVMAWLLQILCQALQGTGWRR
jgi:hypothetical protein